MQLRAPSHVACSSLRASHDALLPAWRCSGGGGAAGDLHPLLHHVSRRTDSAPDAFCGFITLFSGVHRYARHSGVLQVATGQLVRSACSRSVRDNVLLDSHGAATFVCHLHGVLYFGSANSVAQAIRKHLCKLDGAPDDLATRAVGKFVLLDCDRCPSIDSSAIAILLKSVRGSGARLLFSGASPAVLDGLRRRVPAELLMYHAVRSSIPGELADERHRHLPHTISGPRRVQGTSPRSTSRSSTPRTTCLPRCARTTTPRRRGRSPCPTRPSSRSSALKRRRESCGRSCFCR